MQKYNGKCTDREFDFNFFIVVGAGFYILLSESLYIMAIGVVVIDGLWCIAGGSSRGYGSGHGSGYGRWVMVLLMGVKD